MCHWLAKLFHVFNSNTYRITQIRIWQQHSSNFLYLSFGWQMCRHPTILHDLVIEADLSTNKFQHESKPESCLLAQVARRLPAKSKWSKFIETGKLDTWNGQKKKAFTDVVYLTEIWNPHSNARRCVPTNEAYWPFFANNSRWVPSSAILPPEQRAIWFAFCTVLNLWAITKDVLPFIKWSRACCTRDSLVASRALVAYSEKNHKSTQTKSIVQ